MMGGARSLPPDRLRAAVMLHTDATYALLLAGTTGSGLFHIGAARRVFAMMKAGRPGAARTQAFERRWFAFVASLYTANSQFDRAAILIRDALSAYPREPRLYVARGALLDTRLAFTAFDPSSPTQLSRRERALEPAAADYRHALELDPNLPIALLRLCALHMVVRDARAPQNLEAALRAATEPIDRYLAYLLLGADLRAARRGASRLARAESAAEKRPRRRHRAAGVFRRGSIAFLIFATTVKLGSTTLAISYSVACPMKVCAPRSVRP